MEHSLQDVEETHDPWGESSAQKTVREENRVSLLRTGYAWTQIVLHGFTGASETGCYAHFPFPRGLQLRRLRLWRRRHPAWLSLWRSQRRGEEQRTCQAKHRQFWRPRELGQCRRHSQPWRHHGEGWRCQAKHRQLWRPRALGQWCLRRHSQARRSHGKGGASPSRVPSAANLSDTGRAARERMSGSKHMMRGRRTDLDCNTKFRWVADGSASRQGMADVCCRYKSVFRPRVLGQEKSIPSL